MKKEDDELRILLMEREMGILYDQKFETACALILALLPEKLNQAE
jgi:hypothetical protein